MKTIIAYDSMFGNTEKVARAIGSIFEETEDSLTMHVESIQPRHMEDVEILILGSPTRKFQATPAALDFIRKIPINRCNQLRFATFDTRVALGDINSAFLKKMMGMFGYAAEPLAKILRKKGANQLINSEGFYVNDTEGPLKEDELKRAKEWAREIKGLI